MSYIGNQPTSVAFLTDYFSGNNSTTAFTMSVAPSTTSAVLVSISGVLQDPSAYSVNGTTLTFSAAPPSGSSNIVARYMGIPASGVTTTAYRTVTEYTATAGQTTFSPPSYTVGYINVYRNGVRLGAADYTASNGTTVVLGTGATVGDLITLESFYVSSVLNALQTTGGTINAPAGSTPLVVQSNGTTALNVTSNGTYISNAGTIGFSALNTDAGFGVSAAGKTQVCRTDSVNTVFAVQSYPSAGTSYLQEYIKGNTSVGYMTATTSGLTLTGINGLQFTATQSASSDANTLDDYEEGTFTPVITFGGASVGITYNYQTGYYVKIGRVVYFIIRIFLSSKGSSTGQFLIQGLPFATSGIGGGYLNRSFATRSDGGTYNAWQAVKTDDSSYLSFFNSDGTVQLNNTHLVNTQYFTVTGTYETNS